MDPFDVMLRVASAMFWVAAGIVGLVYRLFRMLFFFWRKHHRTRLVFPLSARFEHTHIVGGSGHGKTQLLQQLILYDLERVKEGEASLIIIDSQGDMLGKIRSLSSVGQMPERLVILDPIVDIACTLQSLILPSSLPVHTVFPLTTIGSYPTGRSLPIHNRYKPGSTASHSYCDLLSHYPLPIQPQ